MIIIVATLSSHDGRLQVQIRKSNQHIAPNIFLALPISLIPRSKTYRLISSRSFQGGQPALPSALFIIFYPLLVFGPGRESCQCDINYSFCYAKGVGDLDAKDYLRRKPFLGILRLVSTSLLSFYVISS